MSNAVYAALTRQAGLMQEMQVVANNLANASTTGYKADRAVFAEFLAGNGEDIEHISMVGLAGHQFDLEQGGLRFTGGKFDLAIQGEGFFMTDTPDGVRLTRAGHFLVSAEGRLIDAQGNPVLNPAGGAILIPQEAGEVSIAGDGTISADGQVLGQVGVVRPEGQIMRAGNTGFNAPEGFAPVANARVVQGALEQSNVAPVLEVARMIEVQRAYEAGQAMMDKEDQRLSRFIETLRQL